MEFIQLLEINSALKVQCHKRGIEKTKWTNLFSPHLHKNIIFNNIICCVYSRTVENKTIADLNKPNDC